MIRAALVRDMPMSFADCLKEHLPETPIDVNLARKQHAAYVEALRAELPRVVELPADERFPDCCFIEDTAIVIGTRAAISFLGAPERRGEEIPVRVALHELGIRHTIDIRQPAMIDGGDVLFTGSEIIVGLSKRTNEDGARQLAEIFGEEFPVRTVPVQGSLHLKSVMSAFDSGTILFADNEAGRRIANGLESKYQLGKKYARVFLPDAVPSNVLRLGSTVLIQDGFPRSEAILRGLAAEKGDRVVKLQMSELIKADGALTCCSLLF